MNIKLLALPVFAIVASATVSIAPANAGDGASPTGARWAFAPNIYKIEQPRFPRSADSGPVQVPTVREGAVPKGSSMLGIDPVPQVATSAPRVAPMVNAQVKPNPNFTQLVVPQPKAAFQSTFGKPVSPVTAALPKTATPLALPAQPKPAQALHKIASAPSASKDLHGTLLTPQHRRSAVPTAAHALALKPVESYGKDVGYTPGYSLPSSSGSGNSTSTSVNGVLLSHQHSKGR